MCWTEAAHSQASLHSLRSGLKRMYSGVLERLEAVGQQRGVDSTALIAELKKEHRWHVETA